jgi:hypothetical protein
MKNAGRGLWGGAHRPASCLRNVSFPTWGAAKHSCYFLELRQGEVVRRIFLLRASVHSLLLELLRIARYHLYLRRWVPPSALRVAENRPHGRPDGS